MYFSRFESVIEELFDTSKKLRWQVPPDEFSDYNASFKAPNGNRYNINLTPTQWSSIDEVDMLQGFKGSDREFDKIFAMHHGDGLPGSYVISFSEESDRETRYDITGEGGASSVYGIVINGLSDLLNNRPHIKCLLFLGIEPSRRSLYSRLAPMVARKSGFKFYASRDKKYFYLLR